jgi:hypothetical protein
MKILALVAILLAASATPGLSVCKHHADATAFVSDVNVLSLTAPVFADGTEIKKCMPHCGG